MYACGACIGELQERVWQSEPPPLVTLAPAVPRSEGPWPGQVLGVRAFGGSPETNGLTTQRPFHVHRYGLPSILGLLGEQS